MYFFRRVAIYYYSNELKKLPDVVQSIDKRSSDFKKYPFSSFLSKNSQKSPNFQSGRANIIVCFCSSSINNLQYFTSAFLLQ